MFLLGKQKMTLCKPTMRFVSQIFTARSPMSSIWSQAYLEVKARKEVYLAQEAVPGSEMQGVQEAEQSCYG